MTAAEIVACAARLYQRAAFADNAIFYANDQKAYDHARAAFHEAGRLLDFCESARVWCACGDQVTSEGWPHGDPVLCWVCTAEHKRRIAEAEAEHAEVWRLLITDDGAHPPIPNALGLVENVRMLIREARTPKTCGANARTPLELGVRIMAERGLPLEAPRVIDLLDLIDAGRNRIREETEKREQAEADLAAERTKRCGTCADVSSGETLRICTSETSLCAGMMVPPDHGCPQWRRKDGAA